MDQEPASTDSRDLDRRHRRPAGASDDTVEAVGKASEAVEYVERARGMLYSFHQLMGRADLLFGEAATLLEQAGHPEAAHRMRTGVVGLNVLPGRWTFQVVEEYDDGYYATVRDELRRLEHDLMDGHRHVFEAEMKQQRRTGGRSGHEATPTDVGPSEDP